MQQCRGLWPVFFKLTEAKTGFKPKVLDQSVLFIAEDRTFHIVDATGNVVYINDIGGGVFGGFIVSNALPSEETTKYWIDKFMAHKSSRLNEILASHKTDKE